MLSTQIFAEKLLQKAENFSHTKVSSYSACIYMYVNSSIYAMYVSLISTDIDHEIGSVVKNGLAESEENAWMSTGDDARITTYMSELSHPLHGTINNTYRCLNFIPSLPSR